MKFVPVGRAFRLISLALSLSALAPAACDSGSTSSSSSGCKADSDCGTGSTCQQGACTSTAGNAQGGSGTGPGGTGAGGETSASGGQQAATAGASGQSAMPKLRCDPADYEQMKQLFVTSKTPSALTPADCTVDPLPPGTYSATVDPTRKYNKSAPDTIEVVLEGTNLARVGDAPCVPAFPGHLYSTATKANCEQKFLCGCCTVDLRNDGGKWHVEPTSSLCFEPWSGNDYFFSGSQDPKNEWVLCPNGDKGPSGACLITRCDLCPADGACRQGSLNYCLPKAPCSSDAQCPVGFSCLPFSNTEKQCRIACSKATDGPSPECPGNLYCVEDAVRPGNFSCANRAGNSACDECLHGCFDLPYVSNCCCGEGCICESECRSCGFWDL